MILIKTSKNLGKMVGQFLQKYLEKCKQNARKNANKNVRENANTNVLPVTYLGSCCCTMCQMDLQSYNRI